MAQTTVELRNLLATDFELFDFEYEFDDSKMKKEIEEHVENYFYFHEIGQETPDRFKHVFKTKFIALIGYYNDLYNTSLLEYNPLINQNLDEKLEQLKKASEEEENTSNEANEANEKIEFDGTTKEEVEGEQTENNTKDTNTDHQENTDTEKDEKTDENTNEDTTQETKTESEENTKEDTTQDETSNTKRSDYPQQSLSSGNYLSDEEKTTSDLNRDVKTDTDRTGKEDYTGNTETDRELTANEQSEEKITAETEVNEDEDKQLAYSSTTDGTTDNNQKTTSDYDTDYTSNRENEREENTEYEKAVFGITGITYQELIQKERANILRIKDNIVNELKPCFMMVY